MEIISNKKIKLLRLEHGWSQERLAKVSGLSLRTIQRIEAGESCSVESKLSLASTFDVAPKDLTQLKHQSQGDNELDIPRCISLLSILSTLILLVSISGGIALFADYISFLILVIMSLALTIMSKSVQDTLMVLKLFKWLVFKPYPVKKLAARIRTLHKLTIHLYSSSIFISLIGLLGVLGQQDLNFSQIHLYLSIIGLPILYAVMISEMIIRPIKCKAEILLCID